MSAHRRRLAGRWARAAAAVAALLTVSGCTLYGTARIGSSTVALDLAVQHADAPAGEFGVCSALAVPGLDRRIEAAPAGQSACRFFGEVRIEEFSSMVVRSGDTLYLAIPKDGLGFFLDEPLTAIDLDVTFPGPVLHSSTGVSLGGPTLHVTDAAAVSASGIQAAARATPGVDPGLVLSLVTLLAGVGAGSVAAALLLGRTTPLAAARPPDAGPLGADGDAAADRHDEPDPAIPDPGPAPPEPPLGEPSEDPTIWAPEPDREAGSPAHPS